MAPKPALRLTATQKVGAVALLGSLAVLAFIWIYSAQKDLEAQLKQTTDSGVDYLTLCEFRGNPKLQPCQTIRRNDSQQFATAIRYLSEATAASLPKLSPSSDKILKLGRGNPASSEHVACYRATTYPGFEQIYISPIETDRECSWPNRYHAGSVAIPGQAFGQGAI